MSSGLAQVLDVLQDALDLLTDPESGCALDPLPCRASLVPGLDVAWDSYGTRCGDQDGQLWANLTGVTASTTERGECKRIIWTANIGVIRCAAGLDDNGAAPSVDQLDADAWRQALDADKIREALTCCDTRPDTLRDVEVVTWLALGPSGYAAGGQWSVRGILDVCCS